MQTSGMKRRHCRGVVWVGLVLIAAVGASKLFADGACGKDSSGKDIEVCFKCTKPSGRSFMCYSVYPPEKYSLLPKWILHTKPAYESFGEDFSLFDAPRSWTLLEMRLYPDDQSEAPYDGAVYLPFRAWVRNCNGLATYAKYFENLPLPECPKRDRNQ
jgi:hypothetical protein